MKTTGVSSIPKFGLLVFLGHPFIYIYIYMDIKDIGAPLAAQ